MPVKLLLLWSYLIVTAITRDKAVDKGIGFCRLAAVQPPGKVFAVKVPSIWSASQLWKAIFLTWGLVHQAAEHPQLKQWHGAAGCPKRPEPQHKGTLKYSASRNTCFTHAHAELNSSFCVCLSPVPIIHSDNIVSALVLCAHSLSIRSWATGAASGKSMLPDKRHLHGIAQFPFSLHLQSLSPFCTGWMKTRYKVSLQMFIAI